MQLAGGGGRERGGGGGDGGGGGEVGEMRYSSNEASEAPNKRGEGQTGNWFRFFCLLLSKPFFRFPKTHA